MIFLEVIRQVTHHLQRPDIVSGPFQVAAPHDGAGLGAAVGLW